MENYKSILIGVIKMISFMLGVFLGFTIMAMVKVGNRNE